MRSGQQKGVVRAELCSVLRQRPAAWFPGRAHITNKQYRATRAENFILGTLGDLNARRSACGAGSRARARWRGALAPSRVARQKFIRFVNVPRGTGVRSRSQTSGPRRPSSRSRARAALRSASPACRSRIAVANHDTGLASRGTEPLALLLTGHNEFGRTLCQVLAHLRVACFANGGGHALVPLRIREATHRPPVLLYGIVCRQAQFAINVHNPPLDRATETPLGPFGPLPPSSCPATRRLAC